MKYFLLGLFFLLFTSPALAGEATKWQFSTFSFSGTKPSNRVWVIKYRWSPTTAPDPVFTRVLSGGQWGSSVVTNQLVTGQTSIGTSTADSVWLEVGHSLTTSFTPMMWIQCNRFGDGTPQKSGPIVDGVRVDSSGNPVDNNGNPIEPEEPPPDRYKVEVTYTNSNAFPVSVVVMLNATPGGFIGSFGPTNVEPGSVYKETFYHSTPFKASLTVSRDGIPIETPPDVESVPTDDDDPPRPPDGEPGGNNGPPASGGGGTTPGDSQIPDQPDVPDQPRTGDAEANAEARHKETRGELQRIADALRANGNRAASDADLTNDRLSDISDSVEGIGDKIGNSAGAGSGGYTGATEPAGDSGPLSGLGIAQNLAEARLAIGQVLTGLQSMKANLGLDQDPGTAPLRWSGNVPHFGQVTFDLDATLGSWKGIIRQILLFIMVVFFIRKAFEVISPLFS